MRMRIMPDTSHGRWFVTALLIAACALAALGLGAAGSVGSTPRTPYTATKIEAPDSQANAEFTYRLRGAGDLNRDGVPDFFASAPMLNRGAGRVYLFSGKTGKVLARIRSPQPQAGAQFGFYVEVLGDVNRDGRPDVAVGAQFQDVGTGCGTPEPNNCHEDSGAVWVFSGAVRHQLLYAITDPVPQGFCGKSGSTDCSAARQKGETTNTARFGARIGLAGDVNRDGVGDLIVGAQGNDAPAGCGDVSPAPAGCGKDRGQAFIFNGRNGRLIRTLNVPPRDVPSCSTGCSFGGSVQGPGDVDGDGVPDQLVDAFGYKAGGNALQGRMYVFSGRTGRLIRTIDDPEPQAEALFGFQDAAPKSPGDVNHDGRADLYGNGFTQNGPAGDGSGRAWVFDGRTGKVLYRLDDPTPTRGGQFGFSEARTDFNKDGTPDLYIGQSPHHVATADENGGSYVFDGRNGKLLKALPLPAGDRQTATEENGGPRLGWDVATPGDLNGDGQPDFIAGATFTDVGAKVDQGRMYVFLSRDRTRPTRPTVRGPRRTATHRPTYRFSSRDSDNSRGELRFRCSFDSRRLHPCGRSLHQRLRQGAHVLRVGAIDRAGNRSRITVVRVRVTR